MKKILILLLIIFSVAIAIAIESDLTAEEAQSLESFIKNNLVKEYDAIKAGAITEIFTAEFYKVEIKHTYDTYETTDEVVLVKVKGEFTELKSVNDLTKFIDPAYKVTSLEDAETFAMAIKEIFPRKFDSFRDGIYQVENEWFLIYNKFFDDKDGVVLTVDEDGKITAIETRGEIK